MKSDAKFDKRTLALALIQVVQMWSNPRYRHLLNSPKPAELTEEWFSWFVGKWGVARNIKNGHKARVREYLDREFRRALSTNDPSGCVDAAALHIQRRGWASRGCFPVSLVSKAGFFLRPDRLVPLDRFSMRGLRAFRSANGTGKLKRRWYRDYLDAFDREYARCEKQLKLALNQAWVIDMAERLGCPRRALTSVAIRRKLFDNYLMHAADYRA